MFLSEEVKKLDLTSRWNYTFQALNLETRKNVEDFTLHAAKHPKHRNLNRYRDVLPYDHSRVKLENSSNDYINANVVEATEVGRKYILTQGPLPDTCSHFWQMVWEQDSLAVIMLNKIIEKNTVKCHPYWPMGEDEEIEYSDFRIKNLSERSASAYVVRDLLLEHIASGDSKEIKQFHYMLWPDFGVPSRPETFLEFLYDIRDCDVFNPKYGPPVIHCSAGIGRSGTFCLVDCILQKAENEGKPDNINVKETLLSLRNYRVGLVQTPEQLRFSYLAIIQGIAKLFPDVFEKEHTEDSHKRKAEDTEPPPIPPRKRLPPEKPPRCPQNVETTAEEETLKQKKMVKQLQDGAIDDSTEDESEEDELLDLSESESDVDVTENAEEINENSESEEEDRLVDVGNIARKPEYDDKQSYSSTNEPFPINKPLPPIPVEEGSTETDLTESIKENAEPVASSTRTNESVIDDVHDVSAHVDEFNHQETRSKKLLPVFSVEEEDEDLLSGSNEMVKENLEANCVRDEDKDTITSNSDCLISEGKSDFVHQKLVETGKNPHSEHGNQDGSFDGLQVSENSHNKLRNAQYTAEHGIIESQGSESDANKKQTSLDNEATTEQIGNKARDETELRQRQRRDKKNQETAEMVKRIKQKMREQELASARWALTKKSLIVLGISGALMLAYYLFG